MNHPMTISRLNQCYMLMRHNRCSAINNDIDSKYADELKEISNYILGIENLKIRDIALHRYVYGENWICVALKCGGTSESVRQAMSRYVRQHPYIPRRTKPRAF